MNLLKYTRFHENLLKRKSLQSSIRLVSNNTTSNILDFKDEAEEIQIPVPWGHVAGKWWGNKKIRPVVCLHGWQDNAGTFDTLIPQLPKHISYLALDLPGHGWSSWYPLGMNYNGIMDTIMLLERIRNHFEWNELSLMAHSMGSVISFHYCGAFPDRVDLMVGIDALKSHLRKPEQVPYIMQGATIKLLETHKRIAAGSEPPSYPMEKMVEIWHESTGGSVTKECCKYLLKRNVKESTVKPGNYYFSRDSRWKYAYNPHVPQDVSQELAKRMQMPYLFIKATNSPYYEEKKYFREMLQTMRDSNPNFTWHLVDGTHHLHLTHPLSVSKLIGNFITKNRPIVA